MLEMSSKGGVPQMHLDHNGSLTKTGCSQSERARASFRAISFKVIPLAAFLTVMALGPVSARADGLSSVQLANDTIQLNLGVSGAGVPVIESAQKIKTSDSLLSDAGEPSGLSGWFPHGLVPNAKVIASPALWTTSESDDFFVAQASLTLAKGLTATWVVELAKKGSLFRMHVMLANNGAKKQSIASYPVWNASWNLPASPGNLRWWDALTFNPHQQPLALSSPIDLGSQVYSSPEDGTNPFWVVQGSSGNMYFALGWSGGWQAAISGNQNILTFSVQLPPAETQLVLKPGEQIDGPILEVTPTSNTAEGPSRRFWMAERAALAKGPAPTIPLAYNSWYAVKKNVDADFLSNQVSAMTAYGFDDLVVDAGWYDEPGNWQAAPTKFKPGELESLLGSVKTAGHKAGLWSAPQFVSADTKPVPGRLENPAFFSLFLQAYLLDLWDSNYANLLTGHVQQLRTQFSIDYWKYDQPIFVDQSRAGAMKDVIAFQEALKAVRSANADLTIENCMDGGQMINEMTLLNTQLSWLEDGGNNGLAAAQTNLQTVLGALEFIFPWSAYRFTNLFEQMDQTDDELTKYYCRSAMMGVWGISSDLTLIGDHQQSVIVSEIQNYRRLNEIKLDALYELQQPVRASNTAGATFYSKFGKKAAVLLFRWNGQGALTQQVGLAELDPKQSYEVTDIDTGVKTQMAGADLSANGLTVAFDSARQSALVFIDPLDQ
jgi:hypothetical protein